MTSACENNPVRVGIIDSGLSPNVPNRAARAFRAAPGRVVIGDAAVDELDHGAINLAIMQAAATGAAYLVAQVFFDSLTVSPQPVAAALDWLLDSGARLVNLSLGTRSDSQALRESCCRAIHTGCLLVASVPARGPRVFPGSYSGVLRVTGDARCATDQFSCIRDSRVEFGASPLYESSSGARNVQRGGSSIAAARVTGALAARLVRGLSAQTALQDLAAGCAFRGAQPAPPHRVGAQQQDDPSRDTRGEPLVSHARQEGDRRQHQT